MSEEAAARSNVAIVSRAWAVFSESAEQGDPGALFDQGLYAPGCTITLATDLPGAQSVYVGQAGLIAWLRTWSEDFNDLRFIPEESIEVGGDRVLTILRQSATGRGSGAPVEFRTGVVYTLVDGQIVDQCIYVTADEALKAVGLAE